MAPITEVTVSRPVRLQQRRLPAPMTAVAAVLLAVAAALIFIAVLRGLAPASIGHGTGTPAIVPHPAPGPYGS
jgi:hypothetical protein